MAHMLRHLLTPALQLRVSPPRAPHSAAQSGSHCPESKMSPPSLHIVFQPTRQSHLWAGRLPKLVRSLLYLYIGFSMLQDQLRGT